MIIADSVIGESTLPDLPLSAKDRTEGVRVSAFDELNRVLKRDVGRGSQQEMDMLWHEDKGMDLKSALVAIVIKSFEKEACIILDYKQPSLLPRRESYEVSSGRRDESSGLQEQTSAAKAAFFA